MRRTLWTGLALAAGILVLCLVASASAVSPSVWHPLGSQEFSAVPGWSGPFGDVPVPYGTPAIRIASSTPSQSSPTPASDAPGRTPRPTATARPTGGIGDTAGALRGTATWWNSWGPGLYAAAGGRLRAAMGPGYLHRYVTACARGVCVRVRLTTSCACRPDSRVIDLSLDAFSRLAAPSVGVLEVSISW